MVKIDYGGDEKVQRLQVFHRKWDIFNSMLTYLYLLIKVTNPGPSTLSPIKN